MKISIALNYPSVLYTPVLGPISYTLYMGKGY